jgi:hypothetical protein
MMPRYEIPGVHLLRPLNCVKQFSSVIVPSIGTGSAGCSL